MTNPSLDRRSIVDLDKRHVWHPYTAMTKYIDEVDPFVVSRAEGPFFFDVDGTRYIDANSSWWVATLGHRHPRLVRAMTEQAERLCHVALAGVTHREAAVLAARLSETLPPGLSRVFFSDDGSTALEVAIKMVLGFHANEGRRERRRFVSLVHAFHGETLGVTALGGVELFRRSFADVLMPVHFVTPPRPGEGEDGPAAQALDALFEAHGDEIAGAVVEPLVQGASGMNIYPGWFVRRVREACDRVGALLVVDEVFTGFGRTGTFWTSGSTGVVPDVVCSAKALTSGILPFAATIASERVFEAFLGPADRALYYGHSYCGHPLAAAVALAVLDVYRDEGILEGVGARARMISERFAAMGEIPGVKNPRALGMIGAIDLADGASYLGTRGWRAHAEARKRGAYLRPLGDVVYVAPPLNVPMDVLDELLSIVEASVRAALERA